MGGEIEFSPNKIKEVAMRKAILFLFVFFSVQIFSQTPDVAKVISSKRYVFSSSLYTSSFDLEIRIYDQHGLPVPGGTPLGVLISLNYISGNGRPQITKVEGDSLFYSFLSTYYFRTDSNGVIKMKVYVTGTPYSFSYFKTIVGWEGGTEDEAWARHDSINKISFKVYTVFFTSSGYPSSDKELKIDSSSVFPVLIGPNYVRISGKSKYGDNLIFTAFSLSESVRERVNITLEIFDAKWNRVPAGVPIGVSLKYGKFISGDILKSSVSVGSKEGGSFYLITGKDGKINVTYQPPPITPQPFEDFYRERGETREQAWKDYSYIFYNVFTGFDGLLGDSVANLSFYDMYLEMEVDSLNSDLLVLIGPNTMVVKTKSRHGDQFVYTSSTYSETAEIEVSVYDLRRMPVPEGVPIELIINPITQHIPTTRYYTGKLTGGQIYKMDYDYFGRWVFYFCKTDKWGKIKLTYYPPLKDGLEKFLGLYPWAYAVGDNVPYQSWEVTTDTLEQSSPPLLIGPSKALISFSPSSLPPFKISSKLTIKLLDFRGYPAPRNAAVVLSVYSGTVAGARNLIAKINTDNGTVSLPYLSPTRPMYTTKINDKVTVYYCTGCYPLASKYIDLYGPAISLEDYQLGKFILGTSITKLLSDLNPIKFVGAMKNLANEAELLKAKKKELMDKILNGTITDQDFIDYENAFKKFALKIAELATDVPGTSFTGPVTTIPGEELYQSITQNGIKHVLKNTLKEKLIKEPLKREILRFVQYLANKYLSSSQSSIQSSGTVWLANIGDVKILSDIWTIPAKSGMYEFYALKVQLTGMDSLLKIGVNINDQGAILENIVPSDYSMAGYGNSGVISPGVIEIVNYDSSSGTIDCVIVGALAVDPASLLWYTVSKKVGSSADTLSWLDGATVIFDSSSVSDSTLFFINAFPPPNPYIDSLQIFIENSYAFGSVSLPDTNIQKVNLNKPALMVLPDTLGIYAPFVYNYNTGSWTKIDNFTRTDSTILFNISSTGIYGAGRFEARRNNPPEVSSFRDTTIFSGQVLKVAYTVRDIDGDSLTVWVESTDTNVVASLIKDTLVVTPAEGWYGVVGISLYATDGKDTSVSSFTLEVELPTTVESETPRKFYLSQNYPNPFNYGTVIEFSIPTGTHVKLTIYDILGREVEVLVDKYLEPGVYKVRFNGSEMPTGVYFYRIVAGSFISVKKMLLVK